LEIDQHHRFEHWSVKSKPRPAVVREQTDLLLAMERLGVDRAGLSDAMVKQVLDAADVCISKLGWNHTTMTAVAREAGVSRQTLHRLFENREQMIYALAVRQIEWMLQRAMPKVVAQSTAPDRVVAFTMMWAHGLPQQQRASEAFRSSEFRSYVSRLSALSTLVVDMTGEHLDKALADAPGREHLRYPDDPWSNALVVHHFSSDLRRNVGRHRTKAAEQEHLRRYLIPALFVTD
jgi:AcrR family transcriptional regulator